MTNETTDELTELVAKAICEEYGDHWDDVPESSIGLNPGFVGKVDFRAMAREAIAVVRQWDVGK